MVHIMPSLAEMSIEELVKQMVDCVESTMDIATKKVKVMEIGSIVTQKMIDSFAEHEIYSMSDLMQLKDLKDPFLIQLRAAIEKSATDARFGSQFKFLIALANQALLKRKDKMEHISIFEFYVVLKSDLSREQLGKEDIWIADFSFLSGNEAIQKPLGKTGESKVALGWLHNMSSNYWEVDVGKVEYLDSETKKQFKLRRMPEDEAGILYRNLDCDSYGLPKPLQGGQYLFALTKGFGLIAAKGNEIDCLHHSSFTAGQPVLLPGHLNVDSKGQITEIDCHSGHYGPNDEVLYFSAIKLFERGFINSDCKLNPYYNKIIYEKAISVGKLLLMDLDKVHSPIVVKEIQRWRDENPEKYQELSASKGSSGLRA